MFKSSVSKSLYDAAAGALNGGPTDPGLKPVIVAEETKAETELKTYQKSPEAKARFKKDSEGAAKGAKKSIKENLLNFAKNYITEVSNEAPNIQRLTLTQEEPAYMKKLRESESFVAVGKKKNTKQVAEAFDPKKKVDSKDDPVANKKAKISKAVDPKSKDKDKGEQKEVGAEGSDKQQPGAPAPVADKKTPNDVVDGEKDYDLVDDDPVKGNKTLTGSVKDKIIINPGLNTVPGQGQGGVTSGPFGVR